MANLRPFLSDVAALDPSSVTLACGPFYGIAQHFSLHHGSVPLEIIGRVKAHVIAINKFAWPVTNSWVLISSTD